MAQFMKKFLGAIGLEGDGEYEDTRGYEEGRGRSAYPYYDDDDSYEPRSARAKRDRGDSYDARDVRARAAYEDVSYGRERYYEQPDEREQRRRGAGGQTRSNVVQYPGAQPDVRHHMEIMAMRSYDDARVVIDDLVEERSVLINLEEVDVDVSQRIVDMLSGATYALSASLKKAGANTYLLAPQSVAVTGTYEEEQEQPRRGSGFFGGRK